MAAATHNITIEQSADWNPLPYTWLQSNGTPYDLTGWSAKMQVRAGPGKPVLMELSTAGGGLTLGGINGTIAMFASAALTETLTFTIPAKYDLVLTSPSGSVVRLLEGSVSLDWAITS